jgi:hypothetical protein
MTALLRFGTDVCSGVFVSENAIVTARHCVQREAARMDVSVYRGLGGEHCVSGAEAKCAPISLSVFPHDGDDLVLLVSKHALVDTGSLPLIHLAGSLTEFQAAGFGLGSNGESSISFGAGMQLIQTRFNVSLITSKRIVAFAADDGGRVCDGDSGGPAAVLTPTRSLLLGILSASAGEGECAPKGGEHQWVRLVAYMPFLEAHLGECSRHERHGFEVAFCGFRDTSACKL